MRNLTLEASASALERMKETGGEFVIVLGRLGMGCSAQIISVARNITEEDKADKDLYTVLEQDGVSVWVPEYMEFENDKVALDTQAFSNMVLVVATSAIIPDMGSGCSSSGCSGCSSCG